MTPPKSPSATAPSLELGKPLTTYTGKGLTSRRSVTVNLYKAEAGAGINFILPKYGTDNYESYDKSGEIVLKAHHKNVINTIRNTAIGKGKQRLCFVEHILCAVALCGQEDLYIEVLGYELPMGNGSADLWVELLEKSGLKKPIPEARYTISRPIVVENNGRSVLAYPSDKFTVSYLMEHSHPKIGRIWKSWSRDESIEAITDARTFGSLPEHQLLGFENDVNSFTKDDFTMPLRFKDEPVRHKILDVIGDLILCGVNPVLINANFVSIKGGHALDVRMARELEKVLVPIK